VVLDPGLEVRIYSPTLSPDQLELFYGSTDVTGMIKEIRRSTRASKLEAFEPGDVVAELDAACLAAEDRTLDLTPDGLRVYLVCYDPTVSFSGALRVARRSAPGASFVLDAESYGTVGASPSLVAGELTVYSGGFEGGTAYPLVFQRAATDQPFGEGLPIEGVFSPATSPDVSADGLNLVFGSDSGVMLATRNSVDEPFATQGPAIDASDDTPVTSWNSPAISEDCQSLYAVRYVADTGGGERAWTLEVLTR
jgi:hypothetical protein